LSANWEPKKGIWNKKEFLIERGSLITGRKSIAKETGLSEQNIRTGLSCLRSLGMIEISTTKSTSKFSYITISNYSEYQSVENEDNHQTNQQLTSNQPATNQQLTTTKNIKKEKKEKNKEEHYAVEKEIFTFWNSKKIQIHRDFEKYRISISGRLKHYSKEEIIAAIENYSLVLFGEEYYWTVKWDLDKFLQQKNGLDRFLSENFNADDYVRKEFKMSGRQPYYEEV